MNWMRVAAVSAASGIVGLLSSAVAGNFLVRWYDFNAFEGAPQFFILLFALAGVVGGSVLGLVSAIVVPRQRLEGVRAGLPGVAVGILMAVATAAARVLADIPPTIDGEQLYLSIELRAPVGHASPTSLPGAGYVKLGATGVWGTRKEERGPLFVEDSRLAEGRWVTPALVRVFTSRGGRRLEAGVGTVRLASLVVPLPAHPSPGNGEWSEWLPRGDPGRSRDDQFTCRFKVLRQSESMRVESFGRLTVETVAETMVLDALQRYPTGHYTYFYTARGSERVSALSEFRILLSGRPLAPFDRSKAVALLRASSPTALLIHAPQSSPATPCHLLIDDGARFEVRSFACEAPVVGRLLTSDPQRFAAARDLDVARGWVDRQTFAMPALFLVVRAVVDTRALTVMPVDLPASAVTWSVPPPLALSPDERSFAWFSHNPLPAPPSLGITDWTANRTYYLRIDPDRMPYVGFESLDPAWVARHFRWRRGPDGVDVLEERTELASPRQQRSP